MSTVSLGTPVSRQKITQLISKLKTVWRILLMNMLTRRVIM